MDYVIQQLQEQDQVQGSVFSAEMICDAHGEQSLADWPAYCDRTCFMLVSWLAEAPGPLLFPEIPLTFL